jgi:hypothetical protein
MKNNIFLVFLCAQCICLSSFAALKERFAIQSTTQNSLQAGNIHYSFSIFDNETQKTVSENDLVLTHTKIMHFLAYDASRNVFSHVHPQFDGKQWSVDLSLLTNGNYFFWAQGQLLNGPAFSVSTQSKVINGLPEIKSIPLKDNRKANDLETVVEFDNVKIKAGQMAMINYKVSRTDGQMPSITPYLGADAHIVSVSPDGKVLIHVHPMSGSTPSEGMIHATFPSAGDYRIWIQIIDGGVLRTIPLSVVVSK